ncbi:hypothetical protein [Moraxella nasovis]|nr:hypothetical protein [Moraxella nasovis]
MMIRKPFVVSLSAYNGFPTRRHSSGRMENLSSILFELLAK